MKRIRVPADLLSAVESEVNAIYCPTGATSVAVEAVLRYISEHPQVPTDEQIYEILGGYLSSNRTPRDEIRYVATQWQRRCFVQEEPEEKVEWFPVGCVHGTDIRRPLCDSCYEKYEAYRLRKGEQK